MLGFQLRPGRTSPTGAVASSTAALALFRNGEQGVLYDPNDLSTLFQDSAGTTPVTAAGQPVGLMLDKRLGLVRGPELVANGTFEAGTAGWTAVTGSITTVSGQMRVENTTATEAFAQLDAVTFLAGRTYEIRIDAPTGRVSVSGGFARVGAGPGVGLRLILTATGGALRIGTNGTAAGLTVTADNISVRELPGNHAFQPTAASRPMLRQNATTGAYYLETDGSDDWMSTNPIDFTGTDKVSVFAGVRKLSDAATGMIVELGASTGLTNGSFSMFSAGAGGGEEYTFGSRGTVAKYAVTTTPAFNAPHSGVITGSGHIAADVALIRVNGSQVGQDTGDQGAGNYGNHPLYLFRRAGTTLPFNGHFYGLIITGRLTTDAETRNVERLYANKTGVILA